VNEYRKERERREGRPNVVLMNRFEHYFVFERSFAERRFPHATKSFYDGFYNAENL